MRIFPPRSEIVIGEGILPKKCNFMATFMLYGDVIFIALQSLELLTPLLYIGLTEGATHYTGGTRFMNLLPLVTKNQEKRPAFGRGLFC